MFHPGANQRAHLALTLLSIFSGSLEKKDVFTFTCLVPIFLLSFTWNTDGRWRYLYSETLWPGPCPAQALGLLAT